MANAFRSPRWATLFIANRDEILNAGLPLKRGTVELLDALQAAECPMAIVTSSSLRTAEAHLRLAGIRSRFETILTRDDVVRGEPSPDLYLLAAARFDLKRSIAWRWIPTTASPPPTRRAPSRSWCLTW